MTEKAKPTPGPWASNFDEAITVRAQDGSRICTLSMLMGSQTIVQRRPPNEVEANAMLIAAAPAMLAALKRMMQQPTMSPLEMTPDQRKELWAAHEAARAAITMAEGGGDDERS